MPVLRGRRARRVGARPVVQLVAVASLVAGLIAVSSPAQAAPEKVLQNVSVELGADGSIDEILSTAVHRAGDESRTEKQDFAPVETSAQLPVRIQTSYRLGDRSGTDLSEIEGESGRVVIDVTVQNTTVSPQELTYDAGGVQKTAYALVGTPLTVVASADLGAGNLGTVVTRDELNPAQVTNGVVGEDDSEDSQVQWAAMLAPPRLGSSATFRLVQETDDFQVPGFAFSVQPGLVTDTSVRRLLEAAFSEESGSTVSMESRTIELIGEVNAVLAEAGGVLAEIERELGSAANELGAQTILDLQASSQHVTSSMQQLSSDLASLSDEMTAQLDGANDTALAALRTSVDEVKGLLGDPEGDGPTVATTEGCEAVAPEKKKSATVYEQLVAVSGQLESLAAATDACRTSIEADLLRTVGSVDLGAEACEDSTSAICVLRDSQAELAGHASSLQAFGSDFAARFDETLLGGVQTELDAIVGDLADLSQAARGVRGGGGSGKTEVTDALEDIKAQLEDLRARLTLDGTVDTVLEQQLAAIDGQLDSIGAEADAIVAESVAGQDVLDPSKAAAAAARLDSLQAEVCALKVDASDEVARDELAWLLNGELCSPSSTTPTDGLGIPMASDVENLKGDLAAGDDHFADVEAIAADGAPLRRALTGATAELATLRSTVGQLDDQVGALLTDVVEPALLGSEETSLRNKVEELVAGVEGLTAGLDELPSGCPVPEPLETAEDLDTSLEGLVRAFELVTCNQAGLTDAEIAEIFGAADATIDDSLTDLSGTEQRLDDARVRANDSVGDLVDELGAQLDESGDRVLADGKEVVTTQRRRLDAEVREFDGRLDKTVAGAIQAIEQDVSASNRNLEASEQRLLADLRKVLIDLGDRENNGTGLLGSLVTGATRTGLSNQQITAANETAVSFRRVRAQDLEDVFLQQAQLARALELQEAFPVFGLDLPDGSTHVTVFTFHLDGER